MSKMCLICLSPYRTELMSAWSKGFPRKLLYEKYKPLVWGSGKLTFQSFLQAVSRHKTHNLPDSIVVPVVNSVGQDVQGIAKMVTKLMAKRLETMSPDDMSIKDYALANRVAIDEKKLQLDKNAQMMAFAAIFGIPEVINPIDAEKEHNVQLGPPEDSGDK